MHAKEFIVHLGRKLLKITMLTDMAPVLKETSQILKSSFWSKATGKQAAENESKVILRKFFL